MKKYYYVCDMCGKEIPTDGAFYYAHIMCQPFKDINVIASIEAGKDSFSKSPYESFMNFKFDMCEDCAKKFCSKFNGIYKDKKIMEG